MEQASMTALVSAFARAYHSANNEVKVFDDSLARRLLTDAEYAQIADSMADGIQFFHPGFTGTRAEALRAIVDRQLAPSPLGRAAFAETSFEAAAADGVRQYLILAAGYDTFAYRRPAWAQGLEIFELDRPAMAADKQARLKRAGIAIPENVHFLNVDFQGGEWAAALLQNAAFDGECKTFCSLLGLLYYLPADAFCSILLALKALLPSGSMLAFDYPDEGHADGRETGARAEKQAALADAAGEAMRCGYAKAEMEALLLAHGFRMKAHLEPAEITALYFAAYNRAYPLRPMTAFDNVRYCLAEKE